MTDLQSPKPRYWLTVVVLGILFCIKFGILMNGSLIFGRLAMPPVYDDITYFVDAMERVRTFQSGGFWLAAKEAISTPPHAPYSTFSAAFAFLVIGPFRGAAYFMNVATILLMTMFWVRLFRVQAAVAILFGLAIVSTQWFDWAVTVFHPDLVMGYGAAIVATALVFQQEVLVSTRRQIVLGLAAGLVLLMKPTALLPVVGLLSVASVAGAVASRISGTPQTTLWRRLAVIVIAFLVVAGPYFAVHLLHVLQYMYMAFVADREVWAVKLSTADHLTYYLDSASQLFGVWLYIAAALIVAGLLTVRQSRNWTLAAQLTGLLLCAAAGYAIPTLPEVKVRLFGMLFYGMITMNLATGLLVMRRQTALDPWRASLAPVTGGILALVAVLTFADRQPRFPATLLVDARREYDGVYKFIREQHELKASELIAARRPLFVYQPMPVPVPPQAYKLRAMLDGFVIDVRSKEQEKDIEVVLSTTKDADVIVVPDAALTDTLFKYRINPILAQFRDSLTAQGFTPAGSVDVSTGKILLFTRTPAK